VTQITIAYGIPSAKYDDGTHQPGAKEFAARFVRIEDCLFETNVVNCAPRSSPYPVFDVPRPECRASASTFHSHQRGIERGGSLRIVEV
jgi:hypothetical protein